MELSIIESNDWMGLYLDNALHWQGHISDFSPWSWGKLAADEKITKMRWCFVSDWDGTLGSVLERNGYLPKVLSGGLSEILKDSWED